MNVIISKESNRTTTTYTATLIYYIYPPHTTRFKTPPPGRYLRAYTHKNFPRYHCTLPELSPRLSFPTDPSLHPIIHYTPPLASTVLLLLTSFNYLRELLTSSHYTHPICFSVCSFLLFYISISPISHLSPPLALYMCNISLILLLIFSYTLLINILVYLRNWGDSIHYTHHGTIPNPFRRFPLPHLQGETLASRDLTSSQLPPISAGYSILNHSLTHSLTLLSTHRIILSLCHLLVTQLKQVMVGYSLGYGYVRSCIKLSLPSLLLI